VNTWHNCFTGSCLFLQHHLWSSCWENYWCRNTYSRFVESYILFISR